MCSGQHAHCFFVLFFCLLFIILHSLNTWVLFLCLTENGAFEILLARTFDKEAQDFAKKRAKVEEQAV